MQEILGRIVEAIYGRSIRGDAPLAYQLNDAKWSQKLSHAVHEELGVMIAPEDIESSGSLLQLSILLERRLARDPLGRSLVDTYAVLKQMVKSELSHDINYHWYAAWIGDLLNESDSLDDVELMMRMEEEFGFSISDEDAQAMQTVGQTVRYLWQRSCAGEFALRQRAKDVCRSAFIFHEVRRLLMVRGGVPRTAVRLDARLGDLLPSWYAKFWKQVQGIFRVELPQSRLLVFNWRVEKRTTVKELVNLIASSQDTRDEAPAH